MSVMVKSLGGGSKVNGHITLMVNINSGSGGTSWWRPIVVYLVDGEVDHITYNGSAYTYGTDMWGQNNGKFKINTATWEED